MRVITCQDNSVSESTKSLCYVLPVKQEDLVRIACFFTLYFLNPSQDQSLTTRGMKCKDRSLRA